LLSFRRALWADPGILKAFENRSKFQLTDSAKYFFDKLDTIATPGYIPSEQDVLRSRVRTTGIVENNFEIDGNKFKMFDVGGQVRCDLLGIQTFCLSSVTSARSGSTASKT